VLEKQSGGKNPRKQAFDNHGVTQNLHRHDESAAKMKVKSSPKRVSGQKVKLGNKKEKLNDVRNDDIMHTYQSTTHVLKQQV
jgi:hypothetical protein